MSELPKISEVLVKYVSVSYEDSPDTMGSAYEVDDVKSAIKEYARKVLDYVAEHAQFEKEAILNVKNQLQ